MNNLQKCDYVMCHKSWVSWLMLFSVPISKTPVCMCAVNFRNVTSLKLEKIGLTAMSLGESVEWSPSTVVLTSNAQ